MSTPLSCPRCKAEISPDFHYCPACGKSLRPGHGFLFTHTGIILMALVLGPFALPFVWLSRVITRRAKLLYTAVLVLLGLYLAYVTWHSVSTLYSVLRAWPAA